MPGEPIAVLGAGPAGLAAARELGRGGVAAVVFERGAEVGGIARTVSYKGYGFDVGGHRFFTKNFRVDSLWRELMGPDFLRVPRLSRIYYRGRFFRYPLAVTDTLANLGVWESALILLSYVKARGMPSRDEVTFDQWVSNRFGRRLFEAFFETYTEKVWGIPCTEIRADWAVQRIRSLSLTTALLHALLRNRGVKSLIEAFDYPRRGPGMMWERMREEVERAGGSVRLRSEVVGVVHSGGRITAVRSEREGGVSELPVNHVISSLPLGRLVHLLDPAPPGEVLEAARGLRHRSFLMVGLILDGEHLFPDQWIYVHSPEVRVGRIQNFGNWSPEMVPDPGRSSIGMEYFCDEGDDLWSLPDPELAALASRELAALGLARAEDVVDHVVVRQPDAYPVYDAGYGERVEVIRRYLAGFENLQTVGRSGMHRYNNMDHSILTGLLAAENALGARHDLWEVNEEEEYLEEDRGRPAGEARVFEAVLRRAFARMDRVALGAALGSVTALTLFLATLWLVVKGGEVVGPTLGLLSQYLPGYRVTVQGALLGAGYGFLLGGAFGWLFAYARNLTLVLYVFWVLRRDEALSLRELLDRV